MRLMYKFVWNRIHIIDFSAFVPHTFLKKSSVKRYSSLLKSPKSALLEVISDEYNEAITLFGEAGIIFNSQLTIIRSSQSINY
mmetsp:Transcript_33649/g.46046  ORF Transcript_33649/g.46046 Transcript_33649/m.46046 type:complete len:83 (+) Transcript_33649:988-1236(+)